jgi:hypothetical protein
LGSLLSLLVFAWLVYFRLLRISQVDYVLRDCYRRERRSSPSVFESVCIAESSRAESYTRATEDRCDASSPLFY